jgi:hypothetical protein
MSKLMLTPDADGYSSKDGNEVIATALDGGRSRFRRDKVGAPKTVSVKWTLNPAQYQYWRAFFVTVTKKGTLPFTCDLLSEDGGTPSEHECSFVPDSVNLPAQQGLTYVQQAVLEVKPLPHDENADLTLVALYEVVTGAVPDFLAELARLVNEVAPETIGA